MTEQTYSNSNHIPTLNLLNHFEAGIRKDILHKLNMRKDAYAFLNSKKTPPSTADTKFRTKGPFPFWKLKDGSNLFDMRESGLEYQTDIYEMTFKDLIHFNFAYLSFLPNLAVLTIKFTGNLVMNEYEALPLPFFPSLKYLDLSCNSLQSSALNYIVQIKTLTSLNLMGNFITAEICDMSNLEHLEELNLSYNKIESRFVNLELIRDMKTFPVVSDEASPLEISIACDKERLKREVKISNNTKKTFEQLQTYLQTNVQSFFHNISALKSLKALNLSRNKIHFFDIDPFFIQGNDGFSQMSSIDLSHNLIEEEISIILIMNVPKLKSIDISNNPITKNGSAYTNFEFEIFKNKGILLLEPKPDVDDKKHNLLRKKKLEMKDIYDYPQTHYDVMKIKFEPSIKIIKQIKERFCEHAVQMEMLQREEENESNAVKKIISNMKENVGMCSNCDNIEQDEEKFIDHIRFKRTGSEIFITKQIDGMELNKINEKNERKAHRRKLGTYDEFLAMARHCYGDIKHYKKPKNLSSAYKELRYVLHNPKADESTYI